MLSVFSNFSTISLTMSGVWCLWLSRSVFTVDYIQTDWHHSSHFQLPDSQGWEMILVLGLVSGFQLFKVEKMFLVRSTESFFSPNLKFWCRSTHLSKIHAFRFQFLWKFATQLGRSLTLCINLINCKNNTNGHRWKLQDRVSPLVWQKYHWHMGTVSGLNKGGVSWL